MGEAKRKQQAVAAAASAVTAIDSRLLAQAVRQVVQACSQAYGADCLLFAAVGALALRQLGVAAEPVAGSAIWRVGPGDSDTISHARELSGSLYMQEGSLPGMQFHAWVEAPGLLVDFSTCTLKLKAQQLDAADGGTTSVAWAPDHLWLAGPSVYPRLATPAEVNNALEAGVYCYVRHADIEEAVFSRQAEMLRDLGPAATACVATYRALCAGHNVTVAGVSAEGIQTGPETRPLRPFNN